MSSEATPPAGGAGTGDRDDPDDPRFELPPSGDLAKAAARSVVWSAGQKWGAEALETLTFMALARMVVPEAFGVVALARIPIAFAQLFLDQGLESAIVQRKSLRRSHLDTAFWANFATGAVLTVAGLLLAGPLGHALAAGESDADGDVLTDLVRVLAASFVIGGLNGVPNALLRRALRFRELALRNWLASLTGGGVGVTLALLGYGPWSLVWMQVAQTVVSVPFLWLRCRYRPGLRVRRESLKDLLGFGVNVFGIRILDFAGTQLDRLIVGSALGPAQLGFYAVGQRIGVSLNRVLAQTLGHVILPAFSRVQSDPERLLRGFLAATHVLALVAAPAFLGVAAASPEIVTVAFGPTWVPAVPVVAVLSLVGFLQALSMVNVLVILAVGRPGRVLLTSGVATGAKLAALAFAGRYGIAAVAATYAVEVAILLPAQIVILRGATGLRLRQYLSVLWRPTLSGCAMVSAVLACGFVLPAMAQVARLGILVAVGAAVYVAVVLFLDREGVARLRDLAGGLLRRGEEKGA